MKLPTVTHKQLEILILLYRFRFLNTRQLQTVLNHKYPNRIKVWLSDLTKMGMLNRAYSRSFGENTKPAVYYLGLKSKHLLKGLKEVDVSLLNRIYKEKRRSQAFRERCMFIFNIYLSLERLAKENKSTLYFHSKTELEAHRYLPGPLPDAYIAVKQYKNITRYFLEIISEQLPRFVLRNRIQSLFEYCDFGEWQEHTNHPFPAVLMVCPNYVIKGFLSKFIGQTLETEGSDISFYLTTKDQVEASGMKPDIWQKVAAEEE